MVAKTGTVDRPPWHRVWQFLRALTAGPLSGTEWRQVASILTPPQQALFCGMSAQDQQHGYGVMRSLATEGYEHRELLAAALLHDVGKARYPLHLWERPLVVLAGFFQPSLVRRWGQAAEEAGGWRRPFVVHQQHADWGAQMAAASGCSQRVVRLIRQHQEPISSIDVTDSLERELLSALQRADNAH